MRRFGKKKKDDIIEAEVVVPEDEASDLEKKYEEKGKQIGRKAGKILHESKQKADELKSKIKERDIPTKVKKKTSDISSKVKRRVSKK